jgi:SET domain-containing protein
MNEEFLEVRQTKEKGRGVFAGKDFSKGDLIERAPIIKLPDPEWESLEKTALREYYFNWSADSAAIALGYIEMVNYDENPNAATNRLQAEGQMEIVALREIRKGEEITIRYLCPPWFEVRH